MPSTAPSSVVPSAPSGGGSTSDPAATTSTSSSLPPVRISRISSRYLIFSAADVMHIRRHHNMCSVFAGTTPLAPSQNAFLSLPLEIMVEEARLLLAKGAAYMVDGADMHVQGLDALMADPERRRVYVEGIRAQRATAERLRAEERKTMQAEALARKIASGKMGRKKKKKNGGKGDGGTSSASLPAAGAGGGTAGTDAAKDTDGGSNTDEAAALPPTYPTTDSQDGEDEEVSLFSPSPEKGRAEGTTTLARTSPSSTPFLPKAKLNMVKLSLTPTSSVPKLIPPPSISTSSSPSPPTTTSVSIGQVLPPSSFVFTSPASIPEPRSYALYAHIHSRGYFMTPGIRFGCDFSVYPGDPMRFHAHFLATSFGWDEEIGMLDLVGPGRLATAVKKGFVIGGEKPKDEAVDAGGDGVDTVAGDEEEEPGARVRTFTIEWAGM